MPSRDISLCEQRLIDAWTKALPLFGKYHPELTPFITCSYRSPEEQDADYAIGRTVKGDGASPNLPMGRKITNAKGGESFHNFQPSRAFDYCFKDGTGHAVWTIGYYQLFADVIHSIDSGLVYGGSFKGLSDNDHIEMPQNA